jgi:hypothetical protein
MKDLSTKVSAISGRVKSLSWKLAVIVGVLTWIVNTFAGDAVKAMILPKIMPAKSAPQVPASIPAVKDTANKAVN